MARKTTRKYAYVCAPRNAPGFTVQCCQKLYDLGYMPISPWLLFRNFLDLSNQEELAASDEMAKALIRRCTVFVVCGPPKAQMRGENRYAREIGKHRTMLDGMELLEHYEKQPVPPDTDATPEGVHGSRLRSDS